MRGRLTDQAAVAVALARSMAAPGEPTVAHLLVGLVTEPEGGAGRRLRERGSAAALLVERAGRVPAPPLDAVLPRAWNAAADRPATTVDLLDAGVAAGGADIADLLSTCGYHRDLDGWLTGDHAETWFDHAETFGWQPLGDEHMDPAAARVVAQVRAVGGGAVEILIAGAAAPDTTIDTPDPAQLAEVAARLRSHSTKWDTGLDEVLRAAQTLKDGPRVTVRDLLRAALVAGGDGPRLVLEFVGKTS